MLKPGPSRWERWQSPWCCRNQVTCVGGTRYHTHEVPVDNLSSSALVLSARSSGLSEPVVDNTGAFNDDNNLGGWVYTTHSMETFETAHTPMPLGLTAHQPLNGTWYVSATGIDHRCLHNTTYQTGMTGVVCNPQLPCLGDPLHSIVFCISVAQPIISYIAAAKQSYVLLNYFDRKRLKHS